MYKMGYVLSHNIVHFKLFYSTFLIIIKVTSSTLTFVRGKVILYIQKTKVGG